MSFDEETLHSMAHNLPPKYASPNNVSSPTCPNFLLEINSSKAGICKINQPKISKQQLPCDLEDSEAQPSSPISREIDHPQLQIAPPTCAEQRSQLQTELGHLQRNGLFGEVWFGKFCG